MATCKWRLMAGAALASLCLASAQSSEAATGWAKTHTQAIPLVKATLLGALDPAQTLRITVALQMQNEQALQTLVQQQATPGSANFNKYITPAKFKALYAPTSASVRAVRQYLGRAGLSNISVEPNRLFITATGTVAQIESAFSTKLARFNQKGKQLFVNTAPAQVPQALSGIVLAVLGLNNVQATTPVTACTLTAPTCVRTSYDPQTYWRAYNANPAGKATETSIAVMAEGDVSGVTPDLRAFEAAMHLAPAMVTIVPVGLASIDTAGADEWDLDTQYTTGMAGKVKTLYIYDTTSLTDQDTTLEFNRWATDDLAQVGNASFGICEFFPYLDGSMVADDQVFLEAAAQGQTMFSSTGDTGSFCSVGTPNGAPAGAPFVGYPATSPYVIGVGGTTLLTKASGAYQSEVSWYAGGGGISQFEYSPYWQSPVIPTNNPNVPATFRAIPDIAMDADPNTGAVVYVNGQVEYIGGTSLSSPLAAGAWARLQSHYGNTLGFAAPRLYAGYPAFGTVPGTPGATQKVDGFNDVIVGTDGLYTALPYFDMTTGLGTLDVGAKLAVVPH